MDTQVPTSNVDAQVDFGAAPVAGAPATAPSPAPRSRAGMWWTLGIVGVVVALLGCCCISMFALIGSGGDTLIEGDSVAVIYIDGQISGVSSDGFTGGLITPELIISQLKKAEDDPAVKAIMLRIDSPGGTASASEEIAIEVARLEKPTLASIGDVGASGAYMIASQCDEIMSTNSSAVGSIGVIIEIGDFSDLAKKLGVKFVAIHEGEFKDAGSPWRGLTTTETAMLQSDAKLTYDNFIAIVAKGRGASEPEIRKLATGWAWPGSKAKDLGLVDSIGNYTDAVNHAGKLGNIKGEPNVITYTDDSLGTLFQNLAGLADRLGGMGAAAPTLNPTVPKSR